MDITFDAGIGYFLWSVFLGIILAFIYDIIRVTRRVKKTPDGAVNFEDILYVIVSGCLLLYAAFNKNNGQLRWHGFLGTFSGILLYYIILGNHMVNITVAVWECLLKIVLWIVKIALYPVKLIYKILEKPFSIMCWHTGKGIRRLKQSFRTQYLKKRIRNKCCKKSS